VIVTPPPVPAPEPIRFEVLLSQSWTLFRRNWIVAVPPVIGLVIGVLGAAAFVGTIVAAAFAHGVVAAFAQAAHQRDAPMPDGGFFTIVFGAALIYVVVMLAVGLWSYAAMYGMADAAWAKGTATFADGFTAFRTRAGALILAFIGLFGLAVVAMILMLPTLGLALLAFPLFTMYVVPSVVTGRRDAFTAIAESFALVRRFFGASAIALLVLIAINYGISMVASFPLYPLEFAFLPSAGQTVPHLPPVGFLLATGLWFVLVMVAAQAYLGYYTIAIVGLYRSLCAQPVAGQPPGGIVAV
jgi:hypothetical protein